MAQDPKSSVPARKLGRGLSALMGQPVAINLPGALAAPGLPGAVVAPVVVPAAVMVPVGERIVEIAIELITKNKHQPRTQFDETALNELADSIKRSGVMQPVLVRRAKYAPGVSGGQIAQYELISGERRLRASAIVGLKTVPCVIREINEQESAEWALVENLQREDLGPVEMARAFKRLTVEFGLTQAEIARQVSINAASVSNHVRLLELEPSILDLVNAKKLSFGHARGLLAMPSVHVSLDPAKSRIAMAERAAREQ